MDNTFTLKLAEKIASFRAKKGVTQEVVAANLGVSNKTISKWETGASVPEAEYLCALADYFEITVDELLGRTCNTSSFKDAVSKEFDNISNDETSMKTFSLVLELMRQSIARCSNSQEFTRAVPEHIVSSMSDVYRATGFNSAGYEMLINSPQTNLAVFLYQNEENFSWIDKNSEEISDLFKLLSDISGLKIAKLLSTHNFTKRFTADYICDLIGTNAAHAQELLECAVKARICKKTEVTLRDGKTFLYESNESGMLLLIINLAYEITCGMYSYEYYFGQSSKMIRGDEK